MQDMNTAGLSLLNCTEIDEPGIPARIQHVYPETGFVNRPYQRQLILIPKTIPFLVPGFEQSIGGGVATEQHDPAVIKGMEHEAQFAHVTVFPLSWLRRGGLCRPTLPSPIDLRAGRDQILDVGMT